MLSSLKCPKENGGCGQSNMWCATLDRESNRIILNCTNCKY